MYLNWTGVSKIDPRAFVCGHCGNRVASDKGWVTGNISQLRTSLHLCPSCTFPSFFFETAQIPGPVAGNAVDDLPANVEVLYGEARKAVSASVFTAVALICRKILMHVAVDQGAPEGESFFAYIEFLATENIIPRNARGWVDHIRRRGNEANHEIRIATAEEAHELMTLTEMLLKVVYEFPARVPPAAP